MARTLWSRIREARLFRVLLVYLGACWLVLQVGALLEDRLQLPQWVTPVLLLLLLAGLVVITATAWVQSHPAAGTKVEEVPGAWELGLRDLITSLTRRRLPRLTWARAILGGVVAVSVLFGAAGLYVLLRERGAEISVVKEAAAAPGPGIAVLPFRVVGPGLELWREGMVDLLSTNLDGAAGLRAIDPRAVLSRWRTDIGEGKEASDREAALRVARGVGATYALAGSAVALGGGVRLTAEVFDLGTGKLQGTVVVEGPADSVFALVNRLSIQVLQSGISGAGAGISQLDLSRVTTASLGALKAYLAGEQEYRRNRFTEAVAHFTRAVEADSTFALALHRLSLAYGWLEAFSPRTIEYGQQAARFADRLPRREALLVRAASEWTDGRLLGIQILEELSTRYPDYVEGWYELGEAYFHIGAQELHPRDKFRQAFGRAIELDPTFGPAYIHLIDDAFFRRDTAGARELIARYGLVDPAGPRMSGMRLAYDLVWGDSLSKLAATRMLDTAQADVLLGAGLPLFVGANWEQLLPVSEALSDDRHPPAARELGQEDVVVAYYRGGRIREARARSEAAWGGIDEKGSGVRTSRNSVFWFLLANADPAGARRAVQALASDPEPWDRFLMGAFAASEGRQDEVRRQMEALEADAREAESRRDSLAAADRRAFAQALVGYAALRGGDVRRASSELRETLPGLSGLGPGFVRTGIHALLRYELGRLLLEE